MLIALREDFFIRYILMSSIEITSQKNTGLITPCDGQQGFGLIESFRLKTYQNHEHVIIKRNGKSDLKVSFMFFFVFMQFSFLQPREMMRKNDSYTRNSQWQHKNFNECLIKWKITTYFITWEKMFFNSIKVALLRFHQTLLANKK